MLDTQPISAFRIGDRDIGPGRPAYVIAEAGVNHNGDPLMAKRLIEVAALAGADAVKFQTFRAARLVSPSAPKAEYQLRNTDAGESQFEMLERLELSPAAHRELQDLCAAHGITFLSTAFDEESADLLEELAVPAFKISSGDLTNLPLVAHVARKGKPVILSTGMADLAEVDQALRVLREAVATPQVALLQCVSNYPAHPAEVNLRAMRTMAVAFGVPVGYSDHTEGIEVALASVALGACIVEKHFTLDRNLPGPDHRASLEPAELAAMIRGIRRVEAALGDGRKAPAESELDTARVARRSLTAARDIPAGTRLTRELVVAQRPGTGLPPAMMPYLLGRTLRVSVPAGSILTMEMLD